MLHICNCLAVVGEWESNGDTEGKVRASPFSSTYLPPVRGALANYRLDSVDIPCEVPTEKPLPLFKDMESALKTYIPPAVLRHIESGTKSWLAELRYVTVMFLNLTVPFKEYKLVELQTAICEMQASIYKYEGTVRQFMIDDKGSVLIGTRVQQESLLILQLGLVCLHSATMMMLLEAWKLPWKFMKL